MCAGEINDCRLHSVNCGFRIDSQPHFSESIKQRHGRKDVRKEGGTLFICQRGGVKMSILNRLSTPVTSTRGSHDIKHTNTCVHR